MIYRLRHNTPPETAIAIIKDRCVRAKVERGRKHGYGNGPYFFVEGMPVGEVASGGDHHTANLHFACNLTPLDVLSATLNAALLPSGDRTPYEGKLLLCYRHQDQNGNLTDFREAIILPTNGDDPSSANCLQLIRYEPESLFAHWLFLGRRKRDADALIANIAPFSVGILYT